MSNSPYYERQILIQHDDALVDDVPPHPYHTRLFDIVTLLPEQPRQRQQQEEEQKRLLLLESIVKHNKTLQHQNFVSIMSYEDAIINALKDLRDFHTIGSPVSSIKKHMEEYFVQENFPHLKEMDCTKSCAPADLLNYFNETFGIKNALFVAALKSLLDREIIKRSNHSSSISFSSKYVCEKWSKLKKKMDWMKRNEKQLQQALRLQQQQQKRRQQWKQQVPAARMKPIVSKIRLIDATAVGTVVNLNGGKTKQSEMELDDDSSCTPRGKIFEEQPTTDLLHKLSLEMSKMFVMKRRSNGFVFHKRLKKVVLK